LRKVWDGILACLLLYTALFFPYRVCFIDFKQPPGSVEKWEEWQTTETIVECLFLVDLVMNFFLTYRDQDGYEVKNWYSIVRNYLRTYFIVNLFACMPKGLVERIIEVVASSVASEGSATPKAARFLRVQRASRLIRLLRLLRLPRILKFIEDTILWQRLRDSTNYVRLFNFAATLFLLVHALACGWYLTASFEADLNRSWLVRRVVGPDETLLDRPGPEQWLHACYFVLTVFTTVGFGDMSALTTLELCYVSIVMLVGTIVHSILVSEMINIVTAVDESGKTREMQKALVKVYAQRTDLNKGLLRSIEAWLDRPRRKEVDFDNEAMKDLFIGGAIPRKLCDELPANIYQGRLLVNKFWKLCHTGSLTHQTPHKFTILISMLLKPREFLADETVYCRHDHPIYIFLVASGIFANVAVATSRGGCEERVEHDFDTQLQTTQTPYQLYTWGNYFGDLEIFGHRANRKYRFTTVRCVEEGLTLVLGKRGIEELIVEFPDAAARWASAARRREFARQALVRKHTRPTLCVRDAAASMIQRWIRIVQRNGPTGVKASNRIVELLVHAHGADVVNDQDNTRRLFDAITLLRRDVNQLRKDMLTATGTCGAGKTKNPSVADTTQLKPHACTL